MPSLPLERPCPSGVRVMSRPSGRDPLLIVHSDDFGETVEITKGIRDCIDAGVVTSTTILANMPGTDFALAEAVRRADGASFGVHLNLCEGEPLTAARTLTGPDGRFLPKRAVAARALLGRIDSAALEAELRAQIRRVRDGGVKISHFDSHKHLHQLPGVAAVVARLAAQFGVERIRCTLEQGVWVRGLSGAATVSRLVRGLLARRAAPLFEAQGLRFPDRTFDIRQLMGTDAAARSLGPLVRQGGVTEMICHPGTALADQEKPGSCVRRAELEFLCSPEFRRLVASAGVRLGSYWEC